MKIPSQFNSPLGVLNVGMVIVGTMFVSMGFLAYLQYGENVAGSVTLNLNSKEVQVFYFLFISWYLYYIN